MNLHGVYHYSKQLQNLSANKSKIQLLPRSYHNSNQKWLQNPNPNLTLNYGNPKAYPNPNQLPNAGFKPAIVTLLHRINIVEDRFLSLARIPAKRM